MKSKHGMSRKAKISPMGLNIPLFISERGKRAVGYDNAEKKGDHRHYKGKEYPYKFKDIDKLIEDFFNDVRRIRHED